MRHHRKPSPDWLWATQRDFIKAYREWVIMNFLDVLVSALQRLDSDDVNLSAEISALQTEQTAFEQSVNAQVQAAAAAYLNSIGLAPTQIQALSDRITALETADNNVDAAAGNLTFPPVSTSLSTGGSTTVSSSVSTSLSTVSVPVSTSLSTTVGSGVSTSLSTTASTTV